MSERYDGPRLRPEDMLVLRFPGPPKVLEHDDVAEEYAIVRCQDAALGLVVYAKFHGEWWVNTGAERAVASVLLERLEGAGECLNMIAQRLKALGCCCDPGTHDATPPMCYDDWIACAVRKAKADAEAENVRLFKALILQQHEIQQTLGKALGYPLFKDDPKNWPNATEADGVCVGEHTAESLATEAARRIERLTAALRRYGQHEQSCNVWCVLSAEPSRCTCGLGEALGEEVKVNHV